MTGAAVGGIAAVLAGGVLNGSFVYPMKKIPDWRWENSWLVYSFTGLLLLPWIIAFASVPHIGTVFANTPTSILLEVFLFGLGWGAGSVLFGIGVARMGLAVGYGIILGLLAPVGTFLPLIVLHSDQLWTRQGLALVIGTVIVLGGIFICAAAGRVRERALKTTTSPGKEFSFAAGILICVLAGVLSPMLNFSFVFGERLQREALLTGSTPLMATNSIWCLCLTAGFLVNAGYCVFILSKNKTWRLFSISTGQTHSWVNASLMGVLCFGSFLMYGAGATVLGPLGGIVGWPLFMSMSLITSNTLGGISGEWSGAPRRARLLSLAGLGTLILAVFVISLGGSS